MKNERIQIEPRRPMVPEAAFMPLSAQRKVDTKSLQFFRQSDVKLCFGSIARFPMKKLFLTILTAYSIFALCGQTPIVPQTGKKNQETSIEYQILPSAETRLVTMMTLVFGPSFKNLRSSIGSESKNEDVDFQAVRRDSLILSEFTARLHQWPDTSKFKNSSMQEKFRNELPELGIMETQNAAVAIYAAAKEKDLTKAKKSFRIMTENCNICHRKKKNRWVPVILEP